MSSVKISVIVPVYNAEDYLAHCVGSVLSQPSGSVELILVDDGSTDKSGKICDDYAAQYPNVRTIHKENGGLSSARNAGLKMASGEYVFFLDADDWLGSSPLCELYDIARNIDCNFVRFRLKGSDKLPIFYGADARLSEGLYDRERIMEELYPYLICTENLTLGPVVAVWRSLYRKSFLEDNSLLFDETVRYSEDILFSSMLMTKTELFYYTESGFYYHYRTNPDSISRSFRSDRWDSNKILYRKMGEYFAHFDGYNFYKQLDFFGAYLVMNSVTEYMKYDKSGIWRITKDRETSQMLRGRIGSLRLGLKDRMALYLMRWLSKMRAGGGSEYACK